MQLKKNSSFNICVTSMEDSVTDKVRTLVSTCFSVAGIIALYKTNNRNKISKQKSCEQMSIHQVNSILSFPDTCWRGVIHGHTGNTTYVLSEKISSNSNETIIEDTIPSFDLIDSDNINEKVTVLIGQRGEEFFGKFSIKQIENNGDQELIKYLLTPNEEVRIYGDACKSHDGEITVTPLDEFSPRIMLLYSSIFFITSWLVKPSNVKRKTFVIENQVIEIRKQTVHNKVDEYIITAEKTNYDAEIVQTFTRKFISEDCNPISIYETNNKIEAVYLVPKKKPAWNHKYKLIFNGFVIGTFVWAFFDCLFDFYLLGTK